MVAYYAQPCRKPGVKFTLEDKRHSFSPSLASHTRSTSEASRLLLRQTILHDKTFQQNSMICERFIALNTPDDVIPSRTMNEVFDVFFETFWQECLAHVSEFVTQELFRKSQMNSHEQDLTAWENFIALNNIVRAEAF